MIPDWLHILSIAFLLLGLLCAVIIAVDEYRQPQHMWIMNLVWPVTALFGSVLWLWAYFRYGRLATHYRKAGVAEDGDEALASFAVMVGKAASHCGSGCTLGDICAEWLAFTVPAVAIWFGWQSLFAEKVFAVWILDFIFAYGFGIFFQYFTIAPMRGLGFRAGLLAAVKADTLSLIAWQVGMYGFMAIAYFAIFPVQFGVELKTNSPEFWFAMQIAMLCGFVTSYPVNWWLLKVGIKEKM
ncbi:MAG: DUF4396 domain-containing protein [Rhizobiales bacterium]|nr:DUF4396 domain-containing protein [Hyphomicrobiales bacterium]